MCVLSFSPSLNMPSLLLSFGSLCGRGVGLLFAVPGVIFWRLGWIKQQHTKRMAAFAALIGFQVRA